MSAEILSAAKLTGVRRSGMFPRVVARSASFENATVPLFRKTALLLIASESRTRCYWKSMLVLFTKSATMVRLPVAAKSTAEPPSMINVTRSRRVRNWIPNEGGTRSKRNAAVRRYSPGYMALTDRPRTHLRHQNPFPRCK